MKLKKDNVRESILKAAREEFYLHGYKDASMRDIAAKAGITPGNIYRYFESKDVLLDAIVETTYEKIEEITKLKGKIPFDQLGKTSGFINMAINYALDVVAAYRYEILILIDKSQGSKYEAVRKDLTDFTTKSINKSYPESNEALAEVFAKAAIFSVSSIMADHISEPEAIKSLSREFLIALFSADMFKPKTK